MNARRQAAGWRRRGHSYALDRIMSDSRLDRRAIIDLLASFVRGHAKGDDISRNLPESQRPAELHQRSRNSTTSCSTSLIPFQFPAGGRVP